MSYGGDMHIEHIIYSTAVAILFGLFYRYLTGRELSWIIILSAFAPDLDALPCRLNIMMMKLAGEDHQISRIFITHGDFHNSAVLILYAILAAVLLYPLGFKFIDVFVFSAIGFWAHLLKDSLVFSNAYGLLWNLAPFKFGTGVYNKNFYSIADKDVLIWGFVFLGIAITLRTICERKNWLNEMIDTDRRSRRE